MQGFHAQTSTVWEHQSASQVTSWHRLAKYRTASAQAAFSLAKSRSHCSLLRCQYHWGLVLKPIFRCLWCARGLDMEKVYFRYLPLAALKKKRDGCGVSPNCPSSRLAIADCVGYSWWWWVFLFDVREIILRDGSYSGTFYRWSL